MDQLMAWFGAEAYQRNIGLARAFWAGQGRYVVSLNTNRHWYRQNHDDSAAADLAVRQLEAQAAVPGVNIPTLFADYGTVSTAKYWGGTVEFAQPGGQAYIPPVAQSVDEALAIAPRPADDPAMDAARGIRLFDRVRRQLNTNSLWLRTPDMQGPLNTAGLVMNQEELLMAMYAEQGKVHAFLDRVTDFLIEYAMYLRRASAGRICGNIWPYTFFPQDIGVSFTEDLMPLMSPDLYRDFGIPTLRKLEQALGGLHIHCCGQYGHHVANLARSGLRIMAMEFCHPVTRIEELMPLADGTVFIPGILLHAQDEFRTTTDYYRHLIEKHPRCRFWFACSDDGQEYRQFVEEFGAA